MTRGGRIAFVVAAFVVTSALALGSVVLRRGEALLAARWEWPFALLGLALVPWVLVHLTLRADARLPRVLVPTAAPFAWRATGLRAKLRDLPGVFRAVALACGLCALAGPENVLRGEEGDDQGIDMVVVLDLSGSMRALMDGPGPKSDTVKRPTRLDTAKAVILDFVSRRRSDRIGVVVFGRAAYILSPPTLDKALLGTLVSRMDLDLIDGNGTAIGDAVGVAVARLRRSESRSKAVILLTDGDSNAGAISPTYAAKLAQSNGVRVYTVQIGDGDEVEVQDGTDLFGRPHFVRAHFPVNPELLKQIAQDTGAESFLATDRKSLEESMHSILDRLEKTRFESARASVESLFPFFLLPAFVLLALELVLRATVLRRFP